MKVQCDVCDRNKAAVICCADEAALCLDCDSRVHAANKLATKHQRISLISPAVDGPRCDICQEKSGFFFCLEDRALLCRDCDLSIHSANLLSANHQRFLMPGIRVALETISVPDSPESFSEEVPQYEPPQQNSRYEFPQYSLPQKTSSTLGRPPSPMEVKPIISSRHQHYTSGYNNPAVPARIQGGQGGFGPRNSGMMGVTPSTAYQVSHVYQNPGLVKRSNITEFLTEAVPGWRVDDFFNLADLADGYNTSEISSSKADVSNLADFDWTADLSLFDDQVYAHSQHEVPQIPSPPTATGLSRGSKVRGAVKGNLKQEVAQEPDFADSFVVPDLGLQSSPTSPPLAKRRRNFYAY